MKHGSNFIVFGHGPHYCVGKEYAQNYLAAFLARVATNLEWTRTRTPVSARFGLSLNIFLLFSICEEGPGAQTQSCRQLSMARTRTRTPVSARSASVSAVFFCEEGQRARTQNCWQFSIACYQL